mmetsp:Transcript_7152/g.11296  ORF Transcript_7152/g.11296 Transcript_7152/m.11296 type:complete len:89 (-) Transcript_7152:1156-1422(-)
MGPPSSHHHHHPQQHIAPVVSAPAPVAPPVLAQEEVRQLVALYSNSGAFESGLSKLMEMGYPRERATVALARAGGDVTQAVVFLTAES